MVAEFALDLVAIFGWQVVTATEELVRKMEHFYASVSVGVIS